jgi:hypothetical protein
MTRILCAAGLAAMVLAPLGPATAQIADHLKCYKVKDPVGKAVYTADLTGGLASESGCVVKLPGKLLCVETTKTIVGPTQPPGAAPGSAAGRYVCYKIKCPKTALPAVQWTDQFGARALQPLAPKMLCAPEPAATTTTTTVATTTTTTGPPCVTGACEACGSCGNGECHKSGGGAGCGAPGMSPVCIDTMTCVHTPCSGDADCTDPSRPACVFGGVTGGSGCCALCP